MRLTAAGASFPNEEHLYGARIHTNTLAHTRAHTRSKAGVCHPLLSSGIHACHCSNDGPVDSHRAIEVEALSRECACTTEYDDVACFLVAVL